MGAGGGTLVFLLLKFGMTALLQHLSIRCKFHSSLFAIDAYVIGDSTMDYLFPTWPAKILVPIGFTIWFLRLFLELIGYLRLAINVNAEPMYVPIIKTAEELANEEIKSIRE